MSWASRRRAEYLFGVFLFLAVVIGVPTVIILYKPPTCFDGVMNQTETAVDKGGPCQIVDENYLTPHAVLFSRAFKVRPGVFTGIAYIENPNPGVGVINAPYIFRIYDTNNILVGERQGVAAIMPGAITPVYEGGIPTGNRDAVKAFFEFEGQLTWEKVTNPVQDIVVHDIESKDLDISPRITARVRNTGVKDMKDLTFVATVFDTQGNAFITSSTVLPVSPAQSDKEIVFSWPLPFQYQPSRIDVLPVAVPSRLNEGAKR